jgi:hypothetical protein
VTQIPKIGESACRNRQTKNAVRVIPIELHLPSVRTRWSTSCELDIEQALGSTVWFDEVIAMKRSLVAAGLVMLGLAGIGSAGCSEKFTQGNRHGGPEGNSGQVPFTRARLLTSRSNST